jgi:hypothetical protein
MLLLYALDAEIDVDMRAVATKVGKDNRMGEAECTMRL